MANSQTYRNYFNDPKTLDFLYDLPQEKKGVSYLHTRQNKSFLAPKIIFAKPSKKEKINAQLYSIWCPALPEIKFDFPIVDNFYQINRTDILTQLIKHCDKISAQNKSMAFAMLYQAQTAFTHYLDNSGEKSKSNRPQDKIAHSAQVPPTELAFSFEVDTLQKHLHAEYKKLFGVDYQVIDIETGEMKNFTDNPPAAIIIPHTQEAYTTCPLDSTRMLLGVKKRNMLSNKNTLYFNEENAFSQYNALVNQLERMLTKYIKLDDIIFDIKERPGTELNVKTSSDSSVRDGIKFRQLLPKSFLDTPLNSADITLFKEQEAAFRSNIKTVEAYNYEEGLTGPYVLAMDWNKQSGFYSGGNAPSNTTLEASMFASIGDAKRAAGSHNLNGIMIVKLEQKMTEISFQVGSLGANIQSAIVAEVEKSQLDKQIKASTSSMTQSNLNHQNGAIEVLQAKIERYEAILREHDLTDKIEEAPINTNSSDNEIVLAKRTFKV